MSADRAADSAVDRNDGTDERPAGGPLVGERRDEVELPVIPPSIPRREVTADGRVGAVAYPYRTYEAEIEVARPFMSPRRDRYIVSVDCSRRFAMRADAFPQTETRTVEDALVLPSELSPEQADEKARKAAFEWTLRSSILSDPPEIEFGRVADAYKLFWLAERDGGDAIVDSVRRTERPLDG